jgi:hypothetical protein
VTKCGEWPLLKQAEGRKEDFKEKGNLQKDKTGG